jgi:hypothetical protein
MKFNGEGDWRERTMNQKHASIEQRDASKK